MNGHYNRSIQTGRPNLWCILPQGDKTETFLSVQENTSPLTNAVGLHVALARHAVPPQALMGKAARQTVLHPVVCGCGDHQQDVPYDGTK